MPITAAAGDAFAHKFAKQFAAGFAGNNHAVTMEGLLAPKLSWDWSDATVGEGAPADIMDIFSKSWGMMVDNFVLIDPTVVVDTTNSKVVIAGTLIINITGGVAGETNLVRNPITFILTVDDKEQVTRWEAYWDNENADMLAALGKVTALMKK